MIQAPIFAATAALVLLVATRATAAERQVRPYVGVTFAGYTEFVDPEAAIPNPHLTVGGSAEFLGELFGVEADIGDVPGAFEAGNHLSTSSRVTTFTANVIVAAPRRLTEYSLRPYLVAGGGVMHIRSTTSFNVFDLSSVLPTFDVGAGALGFFTNRIGVAWEVRRFQTFGGKSATDGSVFAGEYVSFWRATMALVIRY